MMNLNKWLLLSKIAALVSCCFMFIAFGLMAGNVSETAVHADWAFTSIAQVTVNMNKTLDELNRPCPGPHDKAAPCGTLADVNKTLGTARGTMGQIEIAARHENKQLTTLDKQEETLYSDLHTTLQAGTGTLNEGTALLHTTKQTVKEIQPVLTETQRTVAEAGVALHSVNSVVTDPSIPLTLKNVQESSKATVATMQSVQGTTEEVHQAVHQYLHPTWPKKVWSVTVDVFKAAKPW